MDWATEPRLGAFGGQSSEICERITADVAALSDVIISAIVVVHLVLPTCAVIGRAADHRPNSVVIAKSVRFFSVSPSTSDVGIYSKRRSEPVVGGSFRYTR